MVDTYLKECPLCHAPHVKHRGGVCNRCYELMVSHMGKVPEGAIAPHAWSKVDLAKIDLALATRYWIAMARRKRKWEVCEICGDVKNENSPLNWLRSDGVCRNCNDRCAKRARGIKIIKTIDKSKEDQYTDFILRYKGGPLRGAGPGARSNKPVFIIGKPPAPEYTDMNGIPLSQNGRSKLVDSESGIFNEGEADKVVTPPAQENKPQQTELPIKEVPPANDAPKDEVKSGMVDALLVIFKKPVDEETAQYYIDAIGLMNNIRAIVKRGTDAFERGGFAIKHEVEMRQKLFAFLMDFKFDGVTPQDKM